jgi:hypothetical protein
LDLGITRWSSLGSIPRFRRGSFGEVELVGPRKWEMTMVFLWGFEGDLAKKK